MKKADIKKELKREAESFTPDPMDSIKAAARAQNLLPEEGADEEIYSRGGAAIKARKRTAVGIISSLAALLLCVALILIFVLKGGGSVPVVPTDFSLSVNDVYGMGAVSTVRLLGENMPSGAFKSLAASAAAQDDVKNYAEKFNEYFTALDSFLGDDIVSTSVSDNTDENYPYDTKMIINGKDFDGNSVSYTMYYTETFVKEDIDEDEKETEFSLSGVMVIDGADYFLEGERKEETEKDESETELKIRAYADLSDRSSFVEMEQEYSEETGEKETEYVYSIYSNGKLVEKTAVEFETENKNGKTETEYELEFRSGTAKGKYKVEREIKNGVTEMKVKYDVNGDKGEFRIREITEDGEKKYQYVFCDGSVAIYG